MPKLLVIDQRDRTTLGRGVSPQDVVKTIEQHPQLGKRTAAVRQHERPVKLENVGHIPRLEARRRFNAEFLKFLVARP